MMRKVTSPGEILLQEYLLPLGITQKELAKLLKCDCLLIDDMINEKEAVTPQMAEKLAAAFNTTSNFWLNAQNAFDTE